MFINIVLPKSKLFVVGLLYRPPVKPRHKKYLDNSLEESKSSNIQACYLIDAFNVTLVSRNRMLLEKQYFYYYSQTLHLVSAFLTFSINSRTDKNNQVY